MQRIQGFAQQGGQSVFTAGHESTNVVQESFPYATVTVFLTGTTVLATLYADNHTTPTPLANPFTANENGYWYFYVVNGRYDVRLSGADLLCPWTIGDVLAYDPGSGGGGGGGGDEYMWTQDVQANGFNLIGAGNVGARCLVLNGTGPMQICANSSGDLQVSDRTQTGRMWVTQAGRVGIGTPTPNAPLEIRRDVPAGQGPTLLLSNTAGGAGSGAVIAFNSTGSGTNPDGQILAVDNGNWSVDLIFSTKVPGAYTNSLAERMRLTADGYVGIGTQPLCPLDVKSSGSLVARLRGGDAGNNNTQLRFWGNVSAKDLWIIGTDIPTPTGTEDFHIYDFTQWPNANAAAITVQHATHYVGINHPNPFHQLDVEGDVNISGVYRINGIELTPGGGGSPGPPGPMPVFTVTAQNVPNVGGNPGQATWTPTGGSGTSGSPYTVNLGIPVGVPGTPGGTGSAGPMPVFTITPQNVANSAPGVPGAATWNVTGGNGTSATPFTVTLGLPVGIQGTPGGTGTTGPPGPIPVFSITAQNVVNPSFGVLGTATWTPTGGSGTSGDPYTVTLGVPVGIQGAPGGGGPGAGVDSFNGRTGPVVSALGDYSADLVTNAVRTDMPGGYTDPAWLTINWGGGRIAGIPGTFTPSPHFHSGADITTGIVGVAHLGAGSPSAANFLRGDGTWETPAGGPGGGAPDFNAPGSVNTTGGPLPAVPGPNPPLLHLATPALTSVILDGQDPANTPSIRIRATGGTFGAPAPVSNLRALGVIQFDGYDGAAYALGAQIQATATATWTSLNRGTRLSFWAALNGSANPRNAMSITGDGGLVLGAASTGNGPETLTAPRGVFIGDGNLEIGNGTIMIGGEDLFTIIGFAAGLAARVDELEKKVH